MAAQNIDKYELRDDNVKVKVWILNKDKTFQFTVKDSTGAAVNITGWAMKFVVCESDLDTGTPFISLTTGSGITLTTAASGILQVAIADDGYGTMAGNREYYYELTRTDAGYEAVTACGSAWLWASPTS